MTCLSRADNPSITYVSRENHKIEDALKKAISQPNIFVALTGATKCGKTVLCRNVLEEVPYVWIEGGQIKNESDIWSKICYELNYPLEIKQRSQKGGRRLHRYPPELKPAFLVARPVSFLPLVAQNCTPATLIGRIASTVCIPL